jgi:delta14-sterol reductase/lamin-B receptor
MPFNFSLQAQYLVYHDPQLPLWGAAALTVMNAAGYYVFRSANLQKHRFRTDPDHARIWGRAPEYIKTKRGSLLLTSGWWGLARHANYFGDLTMALAWCLPCGFAHLTPYFYFIYFAPLLLDRERRDHRVCAEKYGSDWEAYCARVKYRIVPYVY